MKNVTDTDIIEACKLFESMSKASAFLKMNHSTFTSRAKNLGVYKASKSCNRRNGYKLDDILKGKHPQYPSTHLRKRLFDGKIKKEECEKCGIKNWNSSKLSFELHHIDGDRTNHLLCNLLILCPNCHSQTETFKAKNVKYNTRKCLRCEIVIRKDNKTGYCRKCLFKIKQDKIHNDQKDRRITKKCYKCESCGLKLERKRKNNLCFKCYKKTTRLVDRPSKDILLKDVKELGYCGTGRKYGVSDNAIRKWINL